VITIAVEVRRTSDEHKRPTDDVARHVVAMMSKKTSSVQNRYLSSGSKA
jgi:hypothetical protein